jgi:hypothetical protein
MTTEAEAEAAWRACADPRPMLNLVRGRVRDRKFRLFACACCRRVDHLITDDRCRRAIEAVEQYHDGEVSQQAYALAERTATDAYMALSRAVGAHEASRGASNVEGVRLIASMFAAQAVADCFRNVTDAANGCCGALRGHGTADVTNDDQLRAVGERIEAEERAAQAALVRDIFNPFRPVVLDPAWLTSDVIALARGIYTDRTFSAMPILADALQDAGCTDEDVLAHCRDTALSHVRGCWVVDRILGKQ